MGHGYTNDEIAGLYDEDQATIKRLRAERNELRAEVDLLKKCNEITSESWQIVLDGNDNLRAQLGAAKEALDLILPLAKGYAAAHPKVEANRRCCKIADAILQPDSGKDGG